MPRLIDADELIKVLDDTLAEQSKDADIRELLQKSLLVGFAKQVIEDAPTVDAEPVKHGHWIEVDTQYIDETKCSNCGVVECFNKGWKRFNYCPNCGAKMDEVEDEID